MSKWLILKLSQTYRPSFMHFEMTSQFLKLETCCDLETFQNISAWQKKLVDDVIFHFLITSVKIGSWSINFTSICDPVNDINCHPSSLPPLPPPHPILYAYYCRKKVYTPNIKDIDDFEITIVKEYWLFIRYSGKYLFFFFNLMQ